MIDLKPGPRAQLLAGFALAGLMAATRFNHFGSPVSLPDASLAVFWLAGLYLRPYWLPLFIVEAGLLDWVSIAGGVSDWCVTPAYGFLIPTYGCLWLLARRHAWRGRVEWRTLPSLVGSLGLALMLAFAISNTSFYLLSGYFGDLGLAEYARAVLRYFPAYAGYAYVYAAAGLAVHAVLLALPARAEPASPA